MKSVESSPFWSCNSRVRQVLVAVQVVTEQIEASAGRGGTTTRRFQSHDFFAGVLMVLISVTRGQKICQCVRCFFVFLGYKCLMLLLMLVYIYWDLANLAIKAKPTNHQVTSFGYKCVGCFFLSFFFFRLIHNIKI
ncbi:hypothetical protein RchiOBHm_Chr5g0027301 [Rosa chinensis]|uniref:Uncharacterized protein n=1 Tax=Rosa chinensis TaxID=74649 RepID=A0A2P6Q934_ROSCH|nr:hypothetical protein RchiOBHm_Chr5g0027301 [Rosa chinensis]